MKHISLKKLTSLVLAVLMMASMLSMFAVGVSAAETKTYTKVTTAPADWSGEYLIVYEAGNVAFDGSLTTFDATSNTVEVTITDGKIIGDFAANTFTIATMEGGYSLQGASGKYTGQTSDGNGLKTGTSAYLNTISINEDGTVNIVGGGAYLRYNKTSGQYRFRYYKSGSYKNQQPIALYKLDTTAVHTHVDTNPQDYICDECDQCLKHEDVATVDGICDTCKKCMEPHEDTTDDGLCETCKQCVNHADTSNPKDGICDTCNKCMEPHADTTGDGLCETCGLCMNHADSNNDGECETCQKCMTHMESDVPTSGNLAECTAGGTEIWTCKNCDEVMRTVDLDKLYHKFDANGKCTRDNCDAVSPLIVGQTVYITAVHDEVTYELVNITEDVGNGAAYTGAPGKYPLVVEAGVTPDPEKDDYTTVFLKANDGYLGFKGSSNKLFLMEKGTSDADNLQISWIPYVDENGDFKLLNVKYPERSIQFNYNGGNPRFCAYKSSQTKITIVPATKIVNFSLTLDKSVTVNVTYSINPAWLTANAGAKLYFYDGTTKTEVEAKAGENVYRITLTPGRINDALSFVLENNGTVVTTTDVSVKNYADKVNAATAEALGLTAAQFTALKALLTAVDVYATAADSATAGELTNPFGSVIENTETGDLFTAIDGVLKDHASLNLAVDTAKLNDAYTVEVKLGEKVLVTGKLSDYIVGGKLVIDGIYAANFNETITVTVSNGTETVATATLSFNAYLSGVYTTASDAANKNMAVAAYNYGVAADALIAALATAA